MKQHSERKHSKFSASGSERWFNCPGSVALSEGLPDKESVWAKEGTKAHEILEEYMQLILTGAYGIKFDPKIPVEMVQHARDAGDFILSLHKKIELSEVQVETRIHLPFIHPEMFGTFDGAVIDYFGTLHVFDYKYGAGVAVSPKENLQMIFYGLGLAAKFNWNFKKVRLWIIQPRIKGYDGPTFWELTMQELLSYIIRFQSAVHRVIAQSEVYVEGSWCHWCKAKTVCPLKKQAKREMAIAAFSTSPLT